MTINNTIDSYRKRRNRQLPIILVGLVVLLVVVGIIFLVVYLGGGGSTLFATKTPTPTTTFTPTNTWVPTSTATITETPTITNTPTQSAPYNYTVKSGDTLTSIIESQALGDNAIINILILNPNINLDLIKVGDVIILPAPNSPLLTPTPLPTGLLAGTRISYLVMPGDNLGLIAAKYNSTVDAIVKANKTLLGTSTVIHPGWTLLVPINIATPVPTRKTQATSTPTKKP
jgi:D-gamma-glutamyl-meso-diaminopimelic acid endopeptidase CwlS